MNVFKMNLIICIAFIVLIFEKATGTTIHSLLGILFIVMLLFHGIRKSSRMKKCPKSMKCIDILLFVFGIITLLSGSYMIFVSSRIVKSIHIFCMFLFFVFILVHVKQHKKYRFNFI